MKIVVFADLHGSISAVKLAVQISQIERPDKTVFCGDLFGGWHSTAQDVVQALDGLRGVPYYVRGNNDYPTDELFLPCPMEDNAVMYHFGKTLFFTHGHRYNCMVVPPVLHQGDLLVYGHTHVYGVTHNHGLTCINVGSLARPRDGVASYVVLDEKGITAKLTDGQVLQHINW